MRHISTRTLSILISRYLFNRSLHSVFHLFCVLLSVISFSAISFSAISLCSQLRAQTPPPSPPPSQPPPLPEYSTLYQGVEHRSQAQEPMSVLITLPVEEQLEDVWSPDEPLPDEPRPDEPRPDEPRPDEPHLSPLSSLPLIFIPLPLIYVSVGDELQLTVDNRGATSVSFTQSVLLSDPTAPPPLFITPSGTQTEYRLKATQSAAGTYTIRRGRELWRGVIISAPERSLNSPDPSSDLTSLWESMPILRAHINLAQSQADTRRSVPWTWSLHSSSLTPYFLREVKAGLALNHAHPDSPPPPPPPETQLRGPLAFINMSELPIALDLPTSVKILGGTYTTQSPPAQVLRVPQTQTRGVLSLLSPGEGCVLWSTTPLQREGILAFGYTASGGRSWTPPTVLTTLTTVEEFTSSPPAEFSFADSPISSLPGSSSPSIPPSRKRVWVYQGSDRTQRWRVGGGVRPLIISQHILSTQDVLIEVRNLSTMAHPFSIEGHPHQLFTEDGVFTPPRTLSWIPIRGRIKVKLPLLSTGRWAAGALTTNAGEHGLRAWIEVID